MLLDLTVVGTLLLGGALIASWVGRRASAAHRAMYWQAALATLLLVPALSLLVPGWAVLPRFQAAAQPHSAPIEIVGGLHLQTGHTILGDPGSHIVQWGLASLLGMAWILGAVLIAVPMLVSRIRVRRLLARRTRAANPRVSDELQRCAEILQLVRTPQLWWHGTQMPLTCGIVRPVLVLPDSARTWPRERLRAVLLHELGHIRRRDSLFQLIADLANVVYWFHPLVWYASNRYQIEREYACDDLAVRGGLKPSMFAEDLVQTAREFRDSPHCPAMIRRGDLKSRVLSILDERADRSSPSRIRAGVSFAATVAAAVLVTAVEPPPHAHSILAVFSMQPANDVLRVRTRPGDRVSIVGKHQSTVEVRALFTARSIRAGGTDRLLADIDVRTAPRLEAIGPRAAESDAWSVNYEITVPRQFDIQVDGEAADVDVRHVDGSISVCTEQGTLRLGGVAGQVRGVTQSGDINVFLTGTTWRGSGLSLESNSGAIRIAMPVDYSPTSISPAAISRGMSRIAASSETGRVILQRQAR